MKTILYIISVGHSGSTILGNFLNAHSKMLFIGEIVAPIRHKKSFECIYCENNTCPIWNNILTKDLVYKNFKSYSKNKKPEDEREQPGSIYRHLFDNTENEVIIDSSKKIKWMLWNSNQKDFNIKSIFLVRDLRAIVSSLKRKEKQDIKTAANRVKKGIRSLSKEMGKVDFIDNINLKYEDLVTEPVKNGKLITNFCGLEYEETMNNYYEYPSHIFGGNEGPTIEIKSRESIDYKLNEKWKTIKKCF